MKLNWPKLSFGQRKLMLDIFQKRHSTRSFQNREVEEEKLKEILEAAHSAPSAGDLKAREIIVVKDQKTKEALVKASFGQTFIAQASIVLVFFALPEKSGETYNERGRKLYCIQDATIAASFAWLQAVSLGLSACWVGKFNDEEVKKIFKTPKNWQPVVILPIGYSTK